MPNPKIENQLNLALDVTESEKNKSSNLNVGFNETTRLWTVILRYTGTLDNVRELLSSYNIPIKIWELLSFYAVMELPEDLINVVADFENIIYIEKPKRLYFQIINSISVSCINPARGVFNNLYGNGVTVAIIDSGIDARSPAFRNSDGTSRISLLWDQNTDTVYDNQSINEALLSGGSSISTDNTVLPADTSGHGTAVASIAVGNYNTYYNSPSDIGIATRSNIIVVKLGTPDATSFPRTSELMRAIDFCVRYGFENNVPIVINLSFGNNYGSHDGTSLLETYIDSVANIGRTTIVAGTGNEASFAIHTSGTVTENTTATIELNIAPYEPTINIQLWKNYSDIFDISLISPSGRQISIPNGSNATRYGLDSTDILVYYGTASPYSVNQEIYIDFLPKDLYITGGLWKIELTGRKISVGNFQMWLPESSILNGSGFLNPNPDATFTIPSTASSVISVGAYNGYTLSYASFSGRGYNGVAPFSNNKPDIVAPGVNITAISPSGLITVSGTSFATPIVSGVAALLCQWGIIDGNDPWLYGEKIKAYLRRGAFQLPGEKTPSPKTGWGAVCLYDSLPL